MPVEKSSKTSLITKFAEGGIAFLLVVSIAFGSGFVLGGRKSTTNAEVIYSFWGDLHEVQPEGVDFGPFFKAWNLLKDKYVPTTATSSVAISDEELMWGAIQGLTASYGDPYTAFLPPVENKLFEEDIQGSFGGVGMEIGIRDEVLTVISPLKDSPAERAGLRPGDKIIAIDGVSTQGITIEKGVLSIRGEVGTAVVLTIIRDGGAPQEISVTRDTISIPTLRTQMRSDGIFEVSLYSFGATSPELFRNAMRTFAESGSDKLLLDLRGNPGGYLEAAVDMASWFLPVGEIVVQEHFGDGSVPRMYRSKGYDVFGDDLKMVILVDQGSASASEILAGALKEYGIATLIGEKTFGKGSVQELISVTDSTSIKITVARWLTPLGHSISESGLLPDYIEKITPESLKEGRDLQKERAVKYLLQGF